MAAIVIGYSDVARAGLTMVLKVPWYRAPRREEALAPPRKKLRLIDKCTRKYGTMYLLYRERLT